MKNLQTRSSFLWEDFINRYTNNHEEFMFIYRNKEIHLSFALDKNDKFVVAFAFGTKKQGYISKDFNSTEELLLAKLINNKSLKEIWKELD